MASKPSHRPLKFASPEELQTKIDAYFEECDNRKAAYVTKEGAVIDIPDPRPYTITGLAMALDTTRETLLDYEDMEHTDIDPDIAQAFSDTIRKAKIKIHNFAEESLWQPKITSGMVFNLTNNWGWKDQRDITSKGEKIGEDSKKVAELLQELYGKQHTGDDTEDSQNVL